MTTPWPCNAANIAGGAASKHFCSVLDGTGNINRRPIYIFYIF